MNRCRPGDGTSPVEQGDRAHQVNFNDAAGIFGLGLAFRLAGSATRYGSDGGAVHDMGDVVFARARHARCQAW